MRSLSRALGVLMLWLGVPAPAQDTALPFLSFDAIVALSTAVEPDGELGASLDALLQTVAVSNAAHEGGVRPKRPTDPLLGPLLRAALWNIERGIEFDLIRLALSDPARFLAAAEQRTGAPPEPAAVIASQLDRLRGVDLLILNEADLGMPRSGYRDVTADLAAALGMNYAFGVEFVEVDPLGLGADRIEYGDEQLRERLRRELSADPARYRGLHGSAILSRYPIRRARILRLKACYDWYGEERTAIARIEEARRWTAERVFIERVSRELRHGNRMALIAEVAVPESPTGQVTVVAAHLENKCNPACRREQMEQILTAIQEVEDPVILGGDLNTTGASGAPTSVEREISKRIGDADFWALNALRWFTPLVLPRALMFPANYFKNYQDPTARHVPVFATNREAALFRMIERFRFADGHAFDFRGSFGRTANRQRTLGNSNERGPKGFKPTFTFRRDYGGLVGRFKLDWFLIKPLVDDPREPDGSEWFAPHFPVTMSEINGVLPSGLSDHAPITVDLPLVEMRDLGAPPLLSR